MRKEASFAAAAVLVCAAAYRYTGRRSEVDWPFAGGDQGGTHYSVLSDINCDNVSRLHVAWTWKTGEKPLSEYSTYPNFFEAAPLMIDDVLYFSTPYNRVVALNAETGEQKWSYDPKAYELGQPLNGLFVHRGVAAWRDAGKLRIFMNSRFRLICLDAETGKPVSSFGEQGVVDLREGLVWPINKLQYDQTSPPVVYKDIVIVGSAIPDRLIYPRDPPGDVRGFDAHTGKQLWSFHTVPQGREFGVDTWANESWRHTGHTNVWAPMTLDESRGLLYLPVSTPSNDFYGGNRPGNNLFADSLVCLEAETGKRKWHFQVVHHGLWDYDMASPPTLVTITVEGRKIDAVVQETKEGFAFVFDRVSGQTVWPIKEQPVPASSVRGERASPTQPFPSKPPALCPQGLTVDDAFDLTPELKAEAQAEMKKYRLGPLFTPPSYQGTLMVPSTMGGANWGGGAFDPDSGMLYVRTLNLAQIARVVRAQKTPGDARTPQVDADWIGDFEHRDATFHGSLPLTKPPYSFLVAVDLNHGTIAWNKPFGDWSALRQNPALKGVKLPRVLGGPGNQGALVTKGGLIFVGGSDFALHAIDKSSGEEVWRGRIAEPLAYANPMTYRTSEGRQFVVIATGQGEYAALVAFTI